MNKKQQSELYHYADKYIDLKLLFRDGKPKIKELTDYKIKKIKTAVNQVIALAGGKHYLERDFIPQRRTKRLREYNSATGQPVYTAGIQINGGAKINKKVKIDRNLHLTYSRGEYIATSAPLDATTEQTLIKSIKKHSKKINTEVTYLGTNGNYIRPSSHPEHTPLELLTEKALFLQTKYNSMAGRGEKRSNGRLAATMDKWGISLLWEKKLKK